MISWASSYSWNLMKQELKYDFWLNLKYFIVGHSFSKFKLSIIKRNGLFKLWRTFFYLNSTFSNWSDLFYMDLIYFKLDWSIRLELFKFEVKKVLYHKILPQIWKKKFTYFRAKLSYGNKFFIIKTIQSIHIEHALNKNLSINTI